jgi:hypothetical protein
MPGVDLLDALGRCYEVTHEFAGDWLELVRPVEVVIDHTHKAIDWKDLLHWWHVYGSCEPSTDRFRNTKYFLRYFWRGVRFSYWTEDD